MLLNLQRILENSARFFKILGVIYQIKRRWNIYFCSYCEQPLRGILKKWCSKNLCKVIRNNWEGFDSSVKFQPKMLPILSGMKKVTVTNCIQDFIFLMATQTLSTGRHSLAFSQRHQFIHCFSASFLFSWRNDFSICILIVTYCWFKVNLVCWN